MMLLGPAGERLIAVGELVGAHGIRGEARLRLFNAHSSVLAEVTEIFLARGAEPPRPVTLERARAHGGVWLVAIQGVGAPEAARALSGSQVAVRESDLPGLGSAEFYCYQLVGLEVVDDGGEALGTVSDVLSTGAADVLVVTSHGRERLIPMIDRAVGEIDLGRRRIVVHRIEGLLD